MSANMIIFKKILFHLNQLFIKIYYINFSKEFDMEEFFLIRKKSLDKSWNLSDLYEPNNAYDYCEQMLDIPEEYIIEAGMGSDGLEITIVDADEDEDWYMQLQRFS